MEYLPERANRQALLLKTRVKAHDRILRCRINAAFRSQVERRIYAAERGARRNLSCARPRTLCLFLVGKLDDLMYMFLNSDSKRPRRLMRSLLCRSALRLALP